MYFHRDDEDKPIEIDSSIAKIIGALFFIYVYSSIYEFKSFWWDIVLALLVLLGAVLYGIGGFYMEKRYWRVIWTGRPAENINMKYGMFFLSGLFILGFAIFAMLQPVEKLNAFIGL